MGDLPDISPLIPQYLLIVLVGCLVIRFVRGARKRLPLPPGPKGLPFVGNMFDIPREKAWLKYMEWAKHYGEFILS